MADGFNTGGDYADLLAQQATLARRQKLLDEMTARSGSPIVGNNWLSRLVQAGSNVGGAAFAANQQPKQDAAVGNMQSSYGKALQLAMQDYMNKSGGMPAAPGVPEHAQNDPAMSLPGQTLEGGGPLVPETAPTAAVPGDPRAAVVAAMSSRFPEMQALGKEGLSALTKIDSPEKWGAPIAGTDPATGKPALVAHSDRGNTKIVQGALPEVKGVALSAGASLVPSTGGAPMIAGAKPGIPQTGASMGMGGSAAQDYYQVHADGTVHKLDNAPKVTVGGPTVNMGNAQKFGMKELAELAAKDLAAKGTKAQGAVELVSGLNQLEALSKGGTTTGPGANGAVWLGQLATSMGIPFDKTRLTNSEAYQGLATEVWQKTVSQFGGNRGVTSQEAEQIKKITPQLTNSPEARAEMTRIMRNVAQRAVNDYKQANASFKTATETQDATKFDFGPTFLPNEVANPSVPSATPGAPIVKGWN